MRHAALGDHAVTVLWTQVAVLLILARVLGALANRLGQPPIIGSLCAGLVAGPSLFGHVWPAGFQWFRPGTGPEPGPLTAVAGFGLLVLLIALGAETDLPLIRSLGRPAVWLIAASLVVPLAAGAAVAWQLPRGFIGTQPHRWSFTLLVAAAMSVSSLPVIARMMAEMRITRRNVGQLSIAAATANDGAGFVVLALATALAASGGASQLVVAVVGLVVMVVVLTIVGQRAVDRALRRARRHGPDVAAGTAVCVAFTVATAAVAQALGVDAALGAFLAGIVIGRSRFVPPSVLDAVRWTSDAVFAPLYFATAGLSVDVTLLARDSTAAWFAVVLGVAVVSKFVAAYVGTRAARLPGREGVALGFSLNGRGALQVILGSAGLAGGILSQSAYTVVILMSIVSSVLAPPLLRRALHGWLGTTHEQERLEREREMSDNVVVRGQRLLLPSRGSPNSVAAARILDLAWPPSSEVTVLRIPGTRYSEAGLRSVMDTLATRRVHEERSDTDDAVNAILAEANLGYGVIVVGAAEEPTSEHLLPPVIEELLNRSPIPLLIVRRSRRDADGRSVLRPRRILVPITGAAASRAGREVAHTIARNTGAGLEFIHVVTRPSREPALRGAGPRSHPVAATAVLDEARRTAAGKNMDADAVLLDSASSGDAIVERARQIDPDLVVAGTTVRRVHDRPFLGHTVEHLLEDLRGPTVVVVVLPDAQHAAADFHIDRSTG